MQANPTLRRLGTLVLALVMALSLSIGGGLGVAAGADFDPDTDVDYQLGGPAKVPPRVGIVIRDRTAKPVKGRFNVCYINGFQTQDNQKRFWRNRWHLVLKDADGKPVEDESWGEWLLDIRTAAKRRQLGRIMGNWVRGCRADGFDAVEFDNLDSFTRSRKLIKVRNTNTYARRLVRITHRAGLTVAQKNRAQWNGAKAAGFDFAIAEECGQWKECGDYVSHFGRQVIVVEYRRGAFEDTCRRFGDRLPVVLRDLDLTPGGRRAWC